MYIYVSNETPNIDVFFDNLQVTHVRGQILEETHYYPFGLTMAGISSKAAGYLENKKKYNGIELNNDFDLNTYEAFYRDLDPQTGRWWEIDPEIENMELWSPYVSNFDNPIYNSDPLGDEPDGGDDPPKKGFLANVWDGFTEKASATLDAVIHPVETVKNAFTSDNLLTNVLDVASFGTYSDVKTLVTDGPGKFVGGKLFDVAAYVVTDGITKGFKTKPGEVKAPKTNIPESKIQTPLPHYKSIKSIVKNASKPDVVLSDRKITQLKRVVKKSGGTVRTELGKTGSVKGKKHSQVEGYGTSTSSRHIIHEKQN